MMSRVIAGAAILALGLGLSVTARAQGLQPGMRTMIQQGGIEPGPLLGAILPGEGYAPGFGFVPRAEQYEDPADPRWSHHRTSYDGRSRRYGRPSVQGRHRHIAHRDRHHFLR